MLNPAVREVDLFALTAQVFLPLAFALTLLAVPSRFRELMRWVALVGAAATLTLGACRFVDYYSLLETYSDRNVSSLYHPETSLEARSDRAFADANALPLPKPYRSDDLLTRRPWVSGVNTDYALGLDGISLAMVLLTGFVTTVAVIACWGVTENLRAYLILLLALETGLTGAFLALDLLLMFAFAEMTLLPLVLLVSLGGGANRKAAATKVAGSLLAGGACLLAAILALYSVDARDFADPGVVASKAADLRQFDPALTAEQAAGRVAVHTFDFVTLAKVGRAAMLVRGGQGDRLDARSAAKQPALAEGHVGLFAPGTDRVAALARFEAQPVCTPAFQYAVFALLVAGFGVKLAAFPLHGWLTSAYAEASPPVAMALAGLVPALGGYGLVRFAVPICPWGANELSWLLALAGVVGILYGAYAALVATDLTKVLAFTSVSQVGYVVLGVAAWGASGQAYELALSGAVYVLVARGVSAAGLVFAAGVIADRAGHRDLTRLGGLRQSMPLFAGVSVVLFFAATALPGLGGFVGVACVLLGSWQYSIASTIPAVLTTVVTALTMWRAWQRVFLGTNPATAYPEATAPELTALGLCAALAVFLGVAPMLVFVWLDPSVNAQVDALMRLK